MRVGPLLAVIVLFVVFLSYLGEGLVWIMAGVSIVALITLIVLAAKANRFMGPKVLVDDARDRFNRFGRDEAETEKVVVEVQPKDPQND